MARDDDDAGDMTSGSGAGTEGGLGAGNISRAGNQGGGQGDGGAAAGDGGGGTAGEMTDGGTPADAGESRDMEGSGVDATPGLGSVGAGDPGGMNPMAPIVNDDDQQGQTAGAGAGDETAQNG